MKQENNFDNEYENHRLLFRILGMGVFLLGFCLFQLAGYGLASLLFRWTGRAPNVVAHVVGALIGMICMFACSGW